ncbi:MAG: radical SAM protein, partial [Chloroflexota bacterium]|nr:radical SAM protein [Chloroflexota bacterium]
KLHTVVHKEFRARKAWKSLKTGRDAARLGYNLLTLPFARLQLNRAVSSPNRLLPLPHMPPEAAATPTPQEER